MIGPRSAVGLVERLEEAHCVGLRSLRASSVGGGVGMMVVTT